MSSSDGAFSRNQPGSKMQRAEELTAGKFALTTSEKVTPWTSWAFVAEVALCVGTFLI
jgi:hypothetical protein